MKLLMKKVLPLALIMVLTAALFTGCNSDSSSGGSASEAADSGTEEQVADEGEPEDSEDSDTGAAAAASFNDEVIAAGKLVIGTSADYPPYESLSLSGEVEGFDIDMMYAVAKHMAEDGVEIEVEFMNMDFDTIVTALQVGQVDLGVSAFTYDPDRDVQFSTPYLVSEQLVSVTAESGITSIEELAGKKVGAGNGTTGEAAAIEQIPDVQMSNPGNYNIMFEALKNGALDAVVCDGLVAKNFAAANGFVVLEPALVLEENSIIVKNGNDALYAAINDAVEKFVASDEYEELQKKWGIIEEE